MLTALSSTLAASLFACVVAAPPTLTILPLGTYPNAVSDDGTIVVGLRSGGAFRWTAAGGYEAIPAGPSVELSTSCMISGNGLEIVADVPNQQGKLQAAFWEGGSTWSFLPAFVACDAFLLNPYDVNVDGSVAVGLAWFANCQARAFRWDPVNGTVDLGTLVAGRSSRANAVNSVGDIIVGWQDTQNGQRVGAKWVNGVETYMPKYIAPNGQAYTVGEALAVNRAGSVIVGYNVFNAPAGPAWLWNGATNTVSALQNLPQFGGQDALALGVSDDGQTVVGTSGGLPFGRTAIIWQNGAPQNLKTVIESLGGSIAPYTQLGTCTAISPDGRTIVGWGAGPGQPNGWILTFPAECPEDIDGDGSVGPADLALVLGGWGAAKGPADVDGDGAVGPADLALVLGAWGTCD
jgi:probable HAF family extracellular repeat protein